MKPTVRPTVKPTVSRPRLRLAVALLAAACAVPPPATPTPSDEIDLTRPDEERVRTYAGLVPCSAEPEASGCTRGPEVIPSGSGAPRSQAVWFVPVHGGDPVRGPRDALVTVVVFSDFECPHCRRAAETLEQLSAAYPEDVRIVWKDDPLPRHTRARAAALFARAAQSEGGNDAFWAAHAALYARQPNFGTEDFEAIAHDIGVDWNAARRALKSERDAARVEAGMALSRELDLRATPTLFFNGRKIEGARPADEMRAVVDVELERARELVQAGTPAASVYEHIIGSAEKGRD